MSLMKIVLIDNIEEGNEIIELGDYEEGFYLSNDNLYLVDSTKTPWFLWGTVQNYFETNIVEEERATLKSSAVEEDTESTADMDYECPKIPLDRERVNEVDNSGFDMISHDLLLKAIAVTQNPSLAFKNE